MPCGGADLRACPEASHQGRLAEVRGRPKSGVPVVFDWAGKRAPALPAQLKGMKC
jgi:hypothetical protein